MLAIPTSIATLVLVALLVGAFFPAWQSGNWTATTGAAVAAGTPLLFLIAFQRRPMRLNKHPLIVSILSGLGCVVVMISETRSGPAQGGPLVVSLLALGVWVLWQRGQRQQARPPRH